MDADDDEDDNDGDDHMCFPRMLYVTPCIAAWTHCIAGWTSAQSHFTWSAMIGSVRLGSFRLGSAMGANLA